MKFLILELSLPSIYFIVRQVCYFLHPVFKRCQSTFCLKYYTNTKPRNGSGLDTETFCNFYGGSTFSLKTSINTFHTYIVTVIKKCICNWSRLNSTMYQEKIQMKNTLLIHFAQCLVFQYLIHTFFTNRLFYNYFGSVLFAYVFSTESF